MTNGTKTQQKPAKETEDLMPPMPREDAVVFPIYFTLVTDGWKPGHHNLLHLNAYHSPELQRSWNIIPQHFPIRVGTRLKPELIAKLREGAVDVDVCMRELVIWLERFKGKRLPVVSCVAFWHLMHHMSEVTNKMPFVSNPIDVNSFYAGSQGDLCKGRFVTKRDPCLAQQQRLLLVSTAIEKAKEILW